MREADGYSAATANLALAVEPKPPPEGFSDNVVTLVQGDRPRVATERPRRRISLPAFGIAALLVVAAVLTGVLVNVVGDLRAERRITSALLRADAIRLQGGGAVGAVVREGDETLFVARDLSRAPGNDVYQLWFLAGERPVSAGTFEVSDGRVVFRTGASLEGITGAAVTVEPPGGSEQPTSEPVLSSV